MGEGTCLATTDETVEYPAPRFWTVREGGNTLDLVASKCAELNWCKGFAFKENHERATYYGSPDTTWRTMSATSDRYIGAPTTYQLYDAAAGIDTCFTNVAWYNGNPATCWLNKGSSWDHAYNQICYNQAQWTCFQFNGQWPQYYNSVNRCPNQNRAVITDQQWQDVCPHQDNAIIASTHPLSNNWETQSLCWKKI